MVVHGNEGIARDFDVEMTPQFRREIDIQPERIITQRLSKQNEPLLSIERFEVLDDVGHPMCSFLQVW